MSLQEPSAILAFGFGLWTSVQPCPLTLNCAAVSYLCRRTDSQLGAVGAGVLYLAGQVLAYVLLAQMVLGGIAASWRMSQFLQQYVNMMLGPIWIVAAMIVLRLITFRLPGVRLGPKMQSQVSAWGMWSALPLGVLLALAFCPVSAAIFFADLLAIIAADGSNWGYPALYALGAALPAVVLALLINGGSQWIATLMHRTRQVQIGLNRLAGGILLAVGVYYTLRYNLELLP